MYKFTFRFIVALLAFILGVTGTAIWFVNRPSETRIMPAGKWEANLFPTINKRTDAASLPGLKTVNLPGGDLEIRVWMGFGNDGEDGIILRRSSNQWSALFLHGIFARYPPSQYQRQRNLGVPKSGWDKMWQRLVRAEILTLPDASEIGCIPQVLDGISYVVETNTNKIYRAYRYATPQYAQCDEAKRMVEISDILFDEFGMYQQPE